MLYKKKHSLSYKIFLPLNSIQLDTKFDVTIRVMGKYPVLWNCNDFFTVPVPGPDQSWHSFSTKSRLFNVGSSIISQKVGISFDLDFFAFYVESGPKTGSVFSVQFLRYVSGIYLIYVN